MAVKELSSRINKEITPAAKRYSFVYGILFKGVLLKEKKCFHGGAGVGTISSIIGIGDKYCRVRVITSGPSCSKRR